LQNPQRLIAYRAEVKVMNRLTSDVTMLALQKALDGAAARQSAAAENLANVETPSYRPRRVEFQEQLRAALSTLDEATREELGAVDPVSYRYAGPPLRRDGNAVDLETEMTELAESSLQYQAATRLLTRKLQMLRSVATEGGR
jgi:flagellar basal-body rod protein FlgB